MTTLSSLPRLEPTFRWYGPNDLVKLSQIEQIGATGIVSALHHIPVGEVWSQADILQRKDEIEWDRSGAQPRRRPLRWSVVESVNVHEAIKMGLPERDHYIDTYQQTLRNLSECGIHTVCYNFMPVLDWTRTHLQYRLPNHATALRYDKIALAAFDLYLLKREAAPEEWSQEVQTEAKAYLDLLTGDEQQLLIQTVLAGLPGTHDVIPMPEFQAILARYAGIGQQELKNHMAYFLQAVTPVAEEVGVNLCVHPDDPPFPILGLPRVVSTEQDLQDVLNMADSPANGLTFCTGSLGAHPDNDLPGIVERLGHRIHFIHLRSVHREANGSFFEANHLEGHSRLSETMAAIIREQQKRSEAGRTDLAMPFRPDHGHDLLEDQGKAFFPGYSLLGRMKGLAEIRGLEEGIRIASR